MKLSSLLLAYESLDSTNRFLKQCLERNEQLPEGTLVVAWEQTAGYGQYNRTWYSKKGESLTFSVLFYPCFLAPDEQSWLLFFTASSLLCALRNYTKLPINIKWPNDIYLFGKKLGGILIENQVQDQKIVSSVIGIGLNINNQKFPSFLKSTAISLYQASGQFFNIEILLRYLHETLLIDYMRFREGEKETFYYTYQSHLALKGLIEFEDLIEKRKKVGKIVQVLPDGYLKIRTNSQAYKLYAPGQIKLISPVT